MYKAQIEFRAVEDDYNEGESLTVDNVWEETLTADTKSELRNKILEATYSKWADLDDEQINEYDWATEYHTSYLANAENEGSASESEIEAWKKGELKLWAVNCHILVTEVTEKKASL
jgi:hypothetical protein